jgi:hypothetical protein
VSRHALQFWNKISLFQNSLKQSWFLAPSQTRRVPRSPHTWLLDSRATSLNIPLHAIIFYLLPFCFLFSQRYNHHHRSIVSLNGDLAQALLHLLQQSPFGIELCFQLPSATHFNRPSPAFLAISSVHPSPSPIVSSFFVAFYGLFWSIPQIFLQTIPLTSIGQTRFVLLRDDGNLDPFEFINLETNWIPFKNSTMQL